MKLRLTFRTGRHQGTSLEFEGPRTVVLGRASTADVQVYDERISRRHCAVRVDALGARIKDMGSGNGTFLNGTRLEGELPLQNGDVFTLGRTDVGVALLPSGIDIPPTEAIVPPQGAIPTAPVPPVVPPAVPAPAADKATDRRKVAAVCTLCQNVISPADQARAVEHRGRWLCPACAPRIEVPGYTIERTLGEGGMGVVYLARDLAHAGRPVALKVLKATAGFTAEDRARFLREADTAAALDHPNIVRVLTRGEVPPYLYFVMEFVAGRSLREWIGVHGQLPLVAALRVAVQVGHALQHARERHIVHRDIKPDNILVAHDGVAKLADFGLAKSVQTSGFSGLTRPGDGLGTLPYMPPEQIENAVWADHRSDIYSFGATIYHMLTGRPPFVGKTPLDFFTRIRAEAPPPMRQFRQDVPELIETMLGKAMRKNPDERYQEVGQMVATIEAFTRSAFDSRVTEG